MDIYQSTKAATDLVTCTEGGSDKALGADCRIINNTFQNQNQQMEKMTDVDPEKQQIPHFEDKERRPRRWFLLVGSVLAAIGIVVGAGLGTRGGLKSKSIVPIVPLYQDDDDDDNAGSSTPQDTAETQRYLQKIRFMLFGSDIFRFEQDSLEMVATQIMAFDDYPRLDLLSNSSNTLLEQRYALLAISLAWDLTTDGPECQWVHCSCNLNGTVLELDFEDIAGTLPSQISLLTNLRKWTLFV